MHKRSNDNWADCPKYGAPVLVNPATQLSESCANCVWYEHESYRLSAALAYYAAASLAPALVIAVALASLVFGEQAARGQLVEQIEATGSLAVILMWVYYSSQILLFGAAFTQAYANKYGRPMVRPDRAEPHLRRSAGKSQDSESSHRGARHLSHDRGSAR